MRGRIVARLVLAALAAGCSGMPASPYTSAEGRYRVQFPGQPKLRDEIIPLPGATAAAKVAIHEDWSGTARMVMYIDYPPHLARPGTEDAGLDGACQGMITQGQLGNWTKKRISMNGHPGREVTFESQPGRPGAKIAGRARLYLVGHRLYQVFIAGRSGVIQPEAIERFLNSFELLDGTLPTAGPPALGPSPSVGPSPGANPPAQPPPAPNLRPQHARNARPQPSPAPGPGETLGFYNIPEPASAAIEADIPGMGSTAPDRPADEITGLGGSKATPSAIGGASIKSFGWIDEGADVVGGVGAVGANGIKDLHFRLDLDLPPNAILQSMAISCGDSQRWSTRPEGRSGPIAILRRGRPVARSHVAQVGVFSGPQEFDLYVDTEAGIGTGVAFDLEVVVSIGGQPASLTARCRRLGPGAGLLADARPSPAAITTPAPPVPAATPGTPPRQDTPPRPDPPSPTGPGPRDREANEIPAFLNPTGGGATIVSFDWVDRDDDYAGTDGRLIAPGGGKDEHYRLVMDLPPAAFIEEVAITGGPVRWTTRPLAHSWPVAIVSNQELRNRRQSLRVGAFSGHWTFDLYAESHESLRPGQDFGVEVIVFVGGTRHHLTARCRRK